MVDAVWQFLSSFRAGIFEFTLVPETELVLPRLNKANVLRGAFGWECRRLVCGANFHVYSAEDQLVRNTGLLLNSNQLRSQVQQLQADRVTFEFITPTKLIYQEREIQHPEFPYILKRARDRISSLLYFYCGAGEDRKEIYRRLRQLSETLRVEFTNLQHSNNFRITRRKERHPLGGFTGKITFAVT